jgi:hypothetical protein
LLREAWQQCFEGRNGTYSPTKPEIAAIRKGRAAIDRGEFVTLDQLKAPTKSQRLIRSALEEMRLTLPTYSY